MYLNDEQELPSLNMPQTQPNFSGIWQLNVAKSVPRGTAAVQTLMKIEHAGPKLIQRVLVARDDGSESLLVVCYEIGGEATNDAGFGAIRSRANWNSA